MHPDALVTPTDINFSSHGGPTGNVVMHNLRRVAAGLRGEYLAPEKTPEPDENGEDVADGFGNKKFNKKGGKKRKDYPATTDDDWQDQAEYEREEGLIGVGEIALRSNFVQGGEEPEVQATSGAQQPVVKKRKKSAEASQGNRMTDKEARKQAKKERHEQRKRDNEKKRAKEA